MLLLIFFFILVVISFNPYFYLMELLFFWLAELMMLIAIVIYLVIILPGLLYLADKLSRYALDKGLHKVKYFAIFIAILIIVPSTVFVVKIYYDNQEKNLADVVRIPTQKVDTLKFTLNYLPIEVDEEIVTNVNELLSQYEVKKINEWSYNASREKGYILTMVINNKKTIWLIINENHIDYINKNTYYQVVNGPINMELFDQLFEQAELSEAEVGAT